MSAKGERKFGTLLGLISSMFYVFGGALFIAGSVYIVPGLSVQCISEGCSIDVALWYLIGCIFYFLAAVIDLGLQLVQLHQKGRNLFARVSTFRFKPYTESLISGFIYLVGSILFLAGSVLFFPIFNAVLPARYTFRAGSCMYIVGSMYGIIQLLFPSRELSDRREVRRRTMTQIETVIVVSDMGDRLSSYEDLGGESSTGDQTSNKWGCCRCPMSVVLGVVVKLTFICGSSSFLIGGFLFSERLFLEGGYLWLEGSVLFLFASLVSISSVIYDMRRSALTMHSSMSSAETQSSQSARDKRIDAMSWVTMRDSALADQV